ncbi:MAG: hypothetical protein JO370_05685, partial [Paucibacter sp.]|nr:hypothetical protein [Roseateles sp.]
MLLWTSLHAQAGVVLVPVLAQQSLPPKWVNHNGRAEGVCPDILAAMERAEPRLRFTGQNDFRSVPMIESALETGRIGAACAL